MNIAMHTKAIIATKKILNQERRVYCCAAEILAAIVVSARTLLDTNKLGCSPENTIVVKAWPP